MKKVVLCLLVAVAVTGVACAGTRYYACGHTAPCAGGDVDMRFACYSCQAAEKAAAEAAKKAEDAANAAAQGAAKGARDYNDKRVSSPNAANACHTYSGSNYGVCEDAYLNSYSNHRKAELGKYQEEDQ